MFLNCWVKDVWPGVRSGDERYGGIAFVGDWCGGMVRPLSMLMDMFLKLWWRVDGNVNDCGGMSRRLVGGWLGVLGWVVGVVVADDDWLGFGCRGLDKWGEG